MIECDGARLSEVVSRCAQAWGATQRQSDVLRLVLDGLANKEIAGRLKVSPRTVEVHVTALLEKASVDSRTGLVAKSWSVGRGAAKSRLMGARGADEPASPAAAQKTSARRGVHAQRR